MGRPFRWIAFSLSVLVTALAALPVVNPNGLSGDVEDGADALGALHQLWLKYRDVSTGRVPPDGFARARRHVEAMKAAQTMAGTTQLARGAWRALGPGNVGGRVRAVVVDPANPDRLLAGSAGGGIWLTSDGGASWAPVDDFMPSLAVSALAFNPANPNQMYAGTGEGFCNADAIRGAGIYKSVDRGLTWSQLPVTKDWHATNRVAVSRNGSIVLAATDLGLMRSTDGGTSFQPSLSAGTTYTQVLFHPTDNTKAIAAHMAGAEYSTDGGATWSQATGMVQGGRVELAYAPSQPTIVYASFDHPSGGGVYKSVDGGVTFSFVSNPNVFRAQGCYDNVIWVNPQDPNNVVVGGVWLSGSRDGGVAWQNLFDDLSMHVDFHAIVNGPDFSNADNSMRTVFLGCDGGVYRMQDVWVTAPPGASALNNDLAVTQFYKGDGHPATGVIVGGTQDNGTIRYDPALASWSSIFGGDGGFVAFDVTQPDTVYTEMQYLQIVRHTPEGAMLIYGGIGDVPDRAVNFIAPFVLDPGNPQRLLAGGRSLWRTQNARQSAPSWTAIKPPDANAGFISAISVWSAGSDVVWVGHNNGTLFKTANGTAAMPTWTKLPVLMNYISQILLDPADPNHVYVATGSWGQANVQQTIDGGVNWTDATGSGATGLPPAPVNDLERDPTDPNTLYAATEVGIFVTPDGGATWRLPQEGPANVAVDDLFWMGTTLVAVTHGRGMFAVDVNPAGSPAVTVTPDRIDFGSQAIGTTIERTVTIENSGTAPLVVYAIAVAGSGAAPGEFSDAGTTCLGTPVAPGGTCTVRVTYHPSREGFVVASLSIATNAPASPTNVPLTGTGTKATPATTVVLWMANVPAASVHGAWQPIADATAAGGEAFKNPDTGQAKIAPALATPANYVDTTFTASAGTAYRVWVRLRAQNDSFGNDSVHLQFSDSVTSFGSATMRMGSTSSAEFVLQRGPGDTSAHHAWGWTDNGWGTAGTAIYFAVTGTHTVRMQQREDGAIVDQIVLSPDTYLSSAPGPRDNDTTILPPTNGTPPPSSSTIVLWAANVPAANVHGNWRRVSDTTAAGGAALHNPDNAQPKIAPALASPANYFDVTFTASSDTPYRVWIRMKAQNDSLSNDSVHVQFGDSVTASGAPTLRIGTTSSAEFVLRGGPTDLSANHAWGWTDNGWGAAGAPISFAGTGLHTVRVQQREDGAIVDQIVLSPDTYVSTAPGPRDNDSTILPAATGGDASTVVLWTANAAAVDVHGSWQRVSDATAAGGAALQNPDAGQGKIAPALASPTHYFEMTFTAVPGAAYHVWIRLRAQSDSLSNDSVHVQFSDSVTSSGAPAMRIGTISSAEFVLQGGPADSSANHAWGWTDNGWGAPGPAVYFATGGLHTVRVQQREDGAIVDQIVLSPDLYLSSPPGPRDNDNTILPSR